MQYNNVYLILVYNDDIPTCKNSMNNYNISSLYELLHESLLDKVHWVLLQSDALLHDLPAILQHPDLHDGVQWGVQVHGQLQPHILNVAVHQVLVAIIRERVLEEVFFLFFVQVQELLLAQLAPKIPKQVLNPMPPILKHKKQESLEPVDSINFDDHLALEENLLILGQVVLFFHTPFR